MSALPPPPKPPGRSAASIVVIIVLSVALVVVVIIAAVAFIGAPVTTGSAAIPSTPSVAPGPSPQPQPKKSKTPPNERPLVSDSFNEHPNLWTEGARLWFAMWPLKYPNANCRVHTYQAEGHHKVGVFQSDCSGWQASGYDVLFFYVDFKNTSKRSLTLVLRNFALQSRAHESFEPVNVRNLADHPATFLSETQKIPAGGTWHGWVTFDGRVTGIAPASLNYIDGKQTLRKTFDGKAGVS